MKRIKFAHIALLLLIFTSNLFFGMFPLSSTNAEITFPESTVNYYSNYFWDAHAADSFDGGEGTEENPYQIANANQLALLSKIINYRDVDGLENVYEYYQKSYYKLTADIDLAMDYNLTTVEYKWPSIGCTNNPFSGSFDGSNHIISHLVPVNSNATLLFDLVVDAIIKNVCVDYDDIDIDDWIGVYKPTGGIVVQAYGGDITISNCFVKGNFNYDGVFSSMSMYSIGGIVGCAYRNVNKLTIENCGNLSNINALCEKVIVGGIIGETMADTTITNCFNQGKIIAKMYHTDEISKILAGGIIGRNYTGTVNITNCYNSGEIMAFGRDGFVPENDFDADGIVAKICGSVSATRTYSLYYGNLGTCNAYGNDLRITTNGSTLNRGIKISEVQMQVKTTINGKYLIDLLNMN